MVWLKRESSVPALEPDGAVEVLESDDMAVDIPWSGAGVGLGDMAVKDNVGSIP